MNGFHTLKKGARQSLRGVWIRAGVILLLLHTPGLLVGLTEQGIRLIGRMPAFSDGIFAPANPTIPSMTAALLCGGLCFLLWSPLSMGTIRWYWRTSQGEPMGIRDVFFYFESMGRYWKTVGLWCVIGLRTAGWFLLFCFPAGFAAFTVFFARFRFGFNQSFGPLEPLFWLLIWVWLILAGTLTCVVAMRYFLASRLLADKPEAPLHRIVRKSVRLMRGYKGRVFLLALSFGLWYLPAIAGIGCLAASAIPAIPYPGQPWLIASACLFGLQVCLGFFLSPWQSAAMARYAGEILYGAGAEEAGENVTREYICKSGELPIPHFPTIQEN